MLQIFYWWGGLQINWILMWMLAILYFCRSIQPQPSLFFHSHYLPLIWYFRVSSIYSYLCSLFFSYFTTLSISFLSSSFNQVLLSLSFQWLFSSCCCHPCSSLVLSLLFPHFIFPLLFLQLPSLLSFVFLSNCCPPPSIFSSPFLSTSILVLSFLVTVPSYLFPLLFQWPSLLIFFSSNCPPTPTDIFVSLLLLWLYILLTFCGLFINLQILNSWILLKNTFDPALVLYISPEPPIFRGAVGGLLPLLA